MPLVDFDKVEHFNAMEWMSCGTECQRHQYRYGGTVITQDTRFPWRRPSKTWFTVDLIIPAEDKAIIKAYGGKAVDSDTYYCEPGNWFAQFDDAEKMVKFVDEVIPSYLERLEVCS